LSTVSPSVPRGPAQRPDPWPTPVSTLRFARAVRARLFPRYRTRQESAPGRVRALRESDPYYRSLFDASPVGIGLSDEHGHFVAANDALCALLGRSEADLIGRSSAVFTHPEDLRDHRNASMLIDAAEDGVLRLEKRYLRPGGEQCWALLTLTHTAGPHGQTWTLAHLQDITDRKIAEQAMSDSEANLQAVARVMALIRGGVDARQTVVDAAQQLADASHVVLVEPTQSGTLAATAVTDPRLAHIDIPLSATSGAVHVYRTGQPLFVADPAEHPLVSPTLLQFTRARSIFFIPVTGPDAVTGVLVVLWTHYVADLSNRHAAAVSLLADQAGIALHQAKLLTDLQALATTDPLTGLPNRRGWDNQLDALIRTARRTGHPLTVALADLDHFKAFNDTHGHLAGDSLLRAFATTARGQLRVGDSLARWGGEEFALALTDFRTDRALDVLDRIRRAVPQQQTCSIGYATWNTSETAEQLMHRVDQALYAAKHAGRNRTEAHSHTDQLPGGSVAHSAVG
jgi:diguanylate cyclase